MKTILTLFSFVVLYSCSSTDSMNAEKYPQCWHNQRMVMDKCIEMNDRGEKVNALRVEQLLKEGSL